MPRELLTLRQFSERHPAFGVASLRWLRFKSQPTRRRRTDPATGARVVVEEGGNGYRDAFVRVSGRVLIDPEAFFRAVDAQNGVGK